jgi:hypothetical protein
MTILSRLVGCIGPLAVFVAVAAAWLAIWRRGPLLAERWPWLEALGQWMWERRRR